MAGSKRHMDQDNQQVAASTPPAGPLHSHPFPIAATKAATSDGRNGHRTSSGSRHDELSSAVRKPEAPCGTLPRHQFGRRRISA